MRDIFQCLQKATGKKRHIEYHQTVRKIHIKNADATSYLERHSLADFTLPPTNSLESVRRSLIINHCLVNLLLAG